MGLTNTSDLIIETLEHWGVDTVFGLPGDGINGLMEALRVRSDRIRFVLVRHEEAAAFAACGYAKFTGRLGVCIATSGPGGIHLLNGLYDARMDHQPVLALTGQTYSYLIGSRYQQEVDMVQLFSDVADYNVQVNSPEHARLATDLAIRHALGRRSVAHLTVPVDVQEVPYEGEYSKKHVPGMTSQVRVNLAVRPPAEEVERAAAILNGAKRLLIFAGAGAREGRRELAELARKLQAPVVKALLGKDVMPDEDPYCLGGAGLLGTTAAEIAVEECDTILLVGTSFPYLNYLPKPGQARGIQIEVDPTRLGLRYPVEVGLVGDARATLQELLPRVRARKPHRWLRYLQGEMKDWWALMDNRAQRSDTPMKPQRVAAELSQRLDDDAVVITDSGTIATWAARHIRMRDEQRFSCSGNLATMAPALPYAIGAQMAYPERQVVAFIGDGGLLMLGSELSTAAHHGLPVKVVVIKNGSLGMIKWEQMVFLGNPSYGVELPDVDFVAFAEAQGVKGFHAENPEDVGDVLQAALDHEGPSLVEAVVDPYEPPRPARVEAEQAVKLAKALARGQPARKRIGLTLFRDQVKELKV
jgi:pyruvate dehydrogenase (quinone)